MHFRGIGTATPAARYTKAQCLSAFQESAWYARLGPRSHEIASKVLQYENGIDARWLVLDSLNEAFAIDPDTLAQRYAQHAPELATQAARKALAQAALAPTDIGALVVSTCTGYLCPGLSGYVIERLGLGPEVPAYDLVGQGCAAALPNLQLCRSLLTADACEHVLSICVEVSSAAMYLDDDPGVLISACLFGDGAGAAVVSRHAREGATDVKCIDSMSLIDPRKRSALRFEQRNGLLRNILSSSVPAMAAQFAQRVLNGVLGRSGLQASDIRTWIMHPGGRDVLRALERRLDLHAEDLRYSAAVLREYGNLSSASVYFVLQAALTDEAPAGWWWLSSFGAGFACHGALLHVRR
jgi:alkylresorcinol/alkylpyrone synthase